MKLFFILLVPVLLIVLFAVVYKQVIKKIISDNREKPSGTIPKKYKSASVNTYRPVLFFSGLLITLAFALLVLEFKAKNYHDGNKLADEEKMPPEDIEEIPITELPPPPPPVIQTPVFEEKEDDEVIEEPDSIVLDPEEPIEDPIEFTPVEDFEEPEEQVDNNVYNYMELQQKPTFPGGMEGLRRYVAENYNYPHRDREEGNQGVVFVNFTIQKDGSIGDIKVLRGINERLDQEAIRVLKTLPKWTPGKNAGMPVKVSFNWRIRLSVK